MAVDRGLDLVSVPEAHAKTRKGVLAWPSGTETALDSGLDYITTISRASGVIPTRTCKYVRTRTQYDDTLVAQR